ncbi:MAG: hypothetical protein NVSMB56_03740 [Pyrinomonadaceae bacterium]
MIAYENLEDVFASIDERRARLRATVENLNAAQADFRHADDAWTIAEIVEHLVLIENNLTRAFDLMLARYEESSDANTKRHTSPEDFRASASKLAEHATNAADRKIQAPERLRPSGAKTIAESLAALQESRAALRALRPRFEQVNLCAIEFPHPLFGALNLAQWIYFIGLHEARHLRQIKSVIQSSEFAKL